MHALLLLLLPSIVLSLNIFNTNQNSFDVFKDRNGLTILALDDTPEVEERPLCRVGGRCSVHCVCQGKCLVGRFSLHRTCFL